MLTNISLVRFSAFGTDHLWARAWILLTWNMSGVEIGHTSCDLRIVILARTSICDVVTLIENLPLWAMGVAFPACDVIVKVYSETIAPNGL